MKVNVNVKVDEAPVVGAPQAGDLFISPETQDVYQLVCANISGDLWWACVRLASGATRTGWYERPSLASPGLQPLPIGAVVTLTVEG